VRRGDPKGLLQLQLQFIWQSDTVAPKRNRNDTYVITRVDTKLRIN